jgi:hypothetical protein
VRDWAFYIGRVGVAADEAYYSDPVTVDVMYDGEQVIRLGVHEAEALLEALHLWLKHVKGPA